MSASSGLRFVRAAVLLAAAAALLVVGWWAARADAGHRSDETLHVCVAPNGVLRVADSCTSRETVQVLATEAGLQAAEASITSLESRVAGLETANADLQTRVSALEADNMSLKSRVSVLEADNTSVKTRVDDLETLLSGVTRSVVDGFDTLRFAGMNLQIVNGTGSTDATPNGLGNLLVGYNRARVTGTNPSTDRIGSHYLVVGDQHHWTRFAGILAGIRNTASGDWASVTGGVDNTASGTVASVAGGDGNIASGFAASVAGGRHGTVSDVYDSRIGNTDFPDS